MRAIDRALVDEVWREMTVYPPEQIRGEADAFLGRQPHVAAFSHAMTGALDPAVQQAALGLCFLLFKILERSLGRPFPRLEDARIRAAHAATQAWLAEEGGGEPGAIAAGLDARAHPSLVGHIIAVFYGGDAAAGGSDEQVKAVLVLLLATLTDALDLGAVEAEGA